MRWLPLDWALGLYGDSFELHFHLVYKEVLLALHITVEVG